MDDLTATPIEVLNALRAALNQGEKPATERICAAACVFFTAIIDDELRRRKPKEGKGKG